MATQTAVACIARGTPGRTVNLTRSGKLLAQATSTDKIFGIHFTYNGKVTARVIEDPQVRVDQAYMYHGGRSYGGTYRSTRLFPQGKSTDLKATDRVNGAWEFDIVGTGVIISAQVRNGHLVVSRIGPESVQQAA